MWVTVEEYARREKISKPMVYKRIERKKVNIKKEHRDVPCTIPKTIMLVEVDN